MKKKLIIVAVGALVVCGLLMSSGAFAGKGNDLPSGNHYNLNIIGVDSKKQVGDSSGHTMFVKLNEKTKIIMTQNESGEFDVVDRNGADGTAEFNIAPGHYNVYARALGTPGGQGVKITANGTFLFNDTTPGKLISLGYVNINRTKPGKPTSVNINKLFYVNVSLYNATGAFIEYAHYWVFDIPELLEYYWDYDNKGLKLLQVRFYECQLIDPADYPEGNYPKDYCRWGDGRPIEPTRNDKPFVGVT